jgi:hypothetical protein
VQITLAQVLWQLAALLRQQPHRQIESGELKQAVARATGASVEQLCICINGVGLHCKHVNFYWSKVDRETAWAMSGLEKVGQRVTYAWDGLAGMAFRSVNEVSAAGTFQM